MLICGDGAGVYAISGGIIHLSQSQAVNSLFRFDIATLIFSLGPRTSWLVRTFCAAGMKGL